MKSKALWMLLAFVPAVSASVINCTAGAASVPVFSTSSTSGAVGDYTLDCTGGIPTPPGQPVPEVNVFASMTVPVLNTGAWILDDGGSMLSGTLLSPDVVEFLGVPFNAPGVGDLDFQVEGIFVNPSLEPPGFAFNEEVSITGNASIFIENQQQLVAENAVPEPSLTLVLVGLGLTICLWNRRSLARL